MSRCKTFNKMKTFACLAGAALLLTIASSGNCDDSEPLAKADAELSIQAPVSMRGLGTSLRVPEATFSPDDKKLAAVVSESDTAHSIYVWESTTGKLIAQFTENDTIGLRIAFSTEQDFIALEFRYHQAELSSSINRFDLTKQMRSNNPIPHDVLANALAAAPRSHVIAISGDSKIMLYQDDKSTPAKTFAFRAEVMEFSPDRTLLAVAHNGDIGLINIKDGKLVHYSHVAELSINRIKWAHDSSLIATFSNDQVVSVMEANNTLKVVARRTLELPGECAFDDSNRRLIVQGMYGKIWVLDAQTFDVVSRRGSGRQSNRPFINWQVLSHLGRKFPEDSSDTWFVRQPQVRTSAYRLSAGRSKRKKDRVREK